MKKVFTLVLALTLVLSLAACGGEAADDKVIKVGASPAPHEVILVVAAELLKEDGYTLEIVSFDDYILPNKSLDAG